VSDSVGSISVTVNGRDVNLLSLLREVRREMQATDTAATRAGRGLGSNIDAGARQGEAGMLRLQSALARNQAQAGDTEGAIQRLRTALSGITVSTSQTVAVEGQLARLEQAASRAATAVPKTTSALQGLQGVLGAAGLTVGVQQIVAFSQESITLANRTDNAQRSLRALAGTPELYAQALATATAQQRLFGGSLEENISGIQGLITVARSSGVELQRLVDISQRLSVKDPSQGIAGARIALNEALAGDPVSLARRYEIPRAALARIRDESTSAADKLKIIDDYLNNIGITSETVGGAINQETIAFNGLAAAIEKAQIQLGKYLSQKLAPAAVGGTKVLDAVTGGPNQNANLTALIVSLQEYTGQRNQATDANVRFVSSLLDMAGIQSQTTAAQTAEAAAQQAVAEKVAVYQSSVDQLATALASGVISQEQYAQAVAELGAQFQLSGQQAGANGAAIAAQEGATRSAQSATETFTTALDADAQSAVVAEVNAQALAAAKQNLQQAAQAAAQAVLAGGGNIEATAARLANSSSLVDVLTAAYLRLYNAQGLVAGKQRLANQAANTTTLGVANAGSAGRRGAGDDAIAEVAELQRQRTAAAAAERKYQEAVGGTSKELQNVNADLDAATVGSKEYYDLKTQQIELERKLASEQQKAARAGGGRGAKTTAAQKEQEQLLAGQTKYNQESEDLERDHQQTLADIAADGAKKQQEALASLNQTRIRGRADFYRRLADVEDAGQRARLSQQFEAIEQETQQIAQSQGADVAASYRDAAIKAAEAQEDIQKEIKDAQDKGDTGRAEYLAGVLKLQQEADRQELERIRTQGSAVAAETARRYAAEEQQYSEHLDRMALTYQRKFGQTPAGLGAPAPGTPISDVAGSTGAPATAGQPAPVKDTETAGAVASSSSDLAARIGAVESAVREVKAAVDATTGAVRSMTQRGVKVG
jgi:hypothetical protein